MCVLLHHLFDPRFDCLADPHLPELWVCLCVLRVCGSPHHLFDPGFDRGGGCTCGE